MGIQLPSEAASQGRGIIGTVNISGPRAALQRRRKKCGSLTGRVGYRFLSPVHHQRHPVTTIAKPLLNTLRPRQYGRHFPDDIFKRICLNENVSISLKISLKFVPKVQFNNIPALLQIMAWRRPGDKPLSEPMVVSLLTHICVTRSQWVNAGPWVLSLTVHGT